MIDFSVGQSDWHLFESSLESVLVKNTFPCGVKVAKLSRQVNGLLTDCLCESSLNDLFLCLFAQFLQIVSESGNRDKSTVLFINKCKQ